MSVPITNLHKKRKFTFENCERRDLLAADLVADITDRGADVEVGGDVTYFVSYENRGNQTADGAVVEVEIPDGTNFNADGSSAGWVCGEDACLLEVGSLEAGANGEAQLALTTTDAIPSDTRELWVRAEIQSETQEFWRRNNSDWSSTPIERAYHDLRFDITDRGAKVAPGESVLYYITYNNRQDNSASDSVITVTLADMTSFAAEGSTAGWVCEGQTCTLPVGTVEGNATGEVTIATAVSPELTEVRTLVISGEIQSSGADARPGNNDDTSSTPIRQDTHDLAIDFSDRGGKTSAGETVAYYAAYRNRGDSTAANAVISVELPDGTVMNAEGSTEGWTCEGSTCTFSIGNVESGGSGEAVIAITYADELPTDVSYFRVESSIAADGTDTSTRNNQDDSTTPIRSDTHDLRVRITDNGARVKLGESVTYDVTYENRGDSAAVGSTISALLPENTTFNPEASSENWSCEGDICTLAVGDLASGESGEATIAVLVDSDLPADVRYIKIDAKIEAASGTEKRDSDNFDPSYTPIDREYHELKVKITDNGARIAAGGTVTYDVTWRNRSGFSTAVGAAVTVTLPESTAFSPEGSDEGWTCEGETCTLAVGDVEAGTEGASKIAVKLAEELPVGLGYVRVDAAMAAQGSEWSDRDNEDPSVTPIDRDYHDLDVDFTDRGASVAAGGSVIYYATYANKGAFAAAGSSLQVELPESMTFDPSTSSDGWSCDEGVCSFALGDLEAGASGEAAFGVLVSSELPEGTRRLRIYATIDSTAGADRKTNNNRDSSVTPVTEAVEDEVDVETTNDVGEVN